MKEWWHSLQPRERHILIAGTIAVALLMIYVLILDPFHKEMSRLHESVAAKRRDFLSMQQAAAEIENLRHAGSGGQLPSGQSIMGVVDSSAKQFNVGAGIKRIQPDGDHTVKVWAEQIAFDDLIRWLDELQKKYGVATHTITIEGQQVSGLVNVRLELRGGA